MKKIGYTLAEVLITLGIIGVLAAIGMPMVNTLKPDATKILYLKTYDSIVDIIHTSMDNPNIWPLYYEYNNKTFNVQHCLLMAPVDVNLDGFSTGKYQKLCNVLGYGFGVEPDKIFCNTSNQTGNFKTKNGINFWVSTGYKVASSGEPIYQTQIVFDINGEDGDNQGYNESSVNPDRFVLLVTADGSVYPADSMGKKYLETRNTWKKIDYIIEPIIDEKYYTNNILDIVNETDLINLIPIEINPQFEASVTPEDDAQQNVNTEVFNGMDDKIK